MTAINQDIILPAGDYKEIEVLVTKPDRSPVDPVNLQAVYSFSRNERSEPLFSKSSESEGEIVISTTTYRATVAMNGNVIETEELNQETMLVTVVILPEDTKDLKGGFYYHELQAIDPLEPAKPYTLLKGKVNILNTIIRQSEPEV